MIVSEEGEMLGLCDGRHRLIGNPKYKKKKHVQMIRSERMAELFPELGSSGDTDLRIRMAIRDLEKRRERNQEDI